VQTEFEFTCHPPLGRLRVVGDLDVSTLDHLADVLEVMALRGCTRVEVDVEEVPYIDTRSLHVLHEVHRRLRLHGGGVEMVGAGTYHRIVAQHAGYADILPGDPPEAPAVTATLESLTRRSKADDSPEPDGTADPSRA